MLEPADPTTAQAWAQRGPAAWPPPGASAWGDDGWGLWMDIPLAGVVQRLRWIEPGSFWMGSPEYEPERKSHEGPRHRVTLTQGYWLADTACTRQLWWAVMGDSFSRFEGGEQRPVEDLSWDMIHGFLARVQPEVQPWQAALPTEAQWEYACRAGTLSAFSFGDDISSSQANYNVNFPYRNDLKGGYNKATLRVKALAPNRWGLYQMHGNVWEWCEDTQREYGAEPKRDPVGQAPSGPRVLRGGSWVGDAGRMRSANRSADDPGDRHGVYGFRLSLRPTGPGLGSATRSPGESRG
jgi:sulfatase modifying factor 1